jgi:hypothetical protein
MQFAKPVVRRDEVRSEVKCTCQFYTVESERAVEAISV